MSNYTKTFMEKLTFLARKIIRSLPGPLFSVFEYQPLTVGVAVKVT